MALDTAALPTLLIAPELEKEEAAAPDAWTVAMSALAKGGVDGSGEAMGIQHFVLGRTIGQGRYARVRLATLQGHDKMPVCLKVLRKQHICRLAQEEHIISEKDVLASCQHPFVIRLLTTFQDAARLYIALELVSGGELFQLLRKEKRFKIAVARFYSAEIVSAIAYLHDMLIVYRDTKPENILIHTSGHLKLTDFGFAKYLKGALTHTVCGTAAYMAPETVRGKGHGLPVDWWAVGILTFEMVAGQPPFIEDEEEKLFQQIVRGWVQYPAGMDKAAKDFLQRMLIVDPVRRLGCNASGSSAIRGHDFFKSLDWSDVEGLRLTPPFVPDADPDKVFELFNESGDERPDDGTGSASMTNSAGLGSHRRSRRGSNVSTDSGPVTLADFSGWEDYRDLRPEALALAASIAEEHAKRVAADAEASSRQKLEQEVPEPVATATTSCTPLAGQNPPSQVSHVPDKKKNCCAVM